MPLRMFLVSVLAWTAVAQTPSGAEQAAQRLIGMHEAWGPRASSPNLSLAIVEESRTGDDFSYGLRATGAPPGTVFTLISWPVTEQAPVENLRGMTFDKKGVAVCAGRAGTCGDPAAPNDPIHIPFRPVRGEPVRLGIISADGSLKAFTKIVPLPFEGADRTCRVHATLLTPGAELLLIQGSGFTPGSDFVMNTDSEGEKRENKGKANGEGSFTNALLPFKEGITHGTIKIQVKSAACAPSVSVPWGKRG